MSRHPFAAVALCLATSACSQARPEPVRPAPAASARSASVHELGIPPGHLPRAGQCRIWMPGTPPGRQQRARSCAGILAVAPRGSWILYRPARDSRHVRVQVVDDERAVIRIVRVFEVRSGVLVKEEPPGDDDDHGEDRGRGRGRRN